MGKEAFCEGAVASFLHKKMSVLINREITESKKEISQQVTLTG